MEALLAQLVSQSLDPTRIMPSSSTLLHNNNVPSSSQALEIVQERDRMAEDIGHLSHALQLLRVRHLQYQGAVSALRRMPLEVLGQIFVRVLPTTHWILASGRSQLVKLMLVCKAWRFAALVNHSLWAQVALRSHCDVDVIHQKVIPWLARSGSIPKTVYWIQHQVSSSFTPLIKLLTDGPEIRWVKLKLESDGPYFFRKAIDALDEATMLDPTRQHQWDAISGMSVEFTSPCAVAPSLTSSVVPEMFMNFPRSLSSLIMLLPDQASFASTAQTEDADLPYEPNMQNGILKIPSANLQYLDIRCNWRGTHVLDLLQSCPRLISLKADFNGKCPIYHPAGDLDRGRMIFPHLQSLTLNKVGTLDQLRHLQAPNLRKLDLTLGGAAWDFDGCPDAGADEIVPTLLEFLRVSGKLSPIAQGSVPLKYLRLSEAFYIPSPDFHELLESTIQVQRMTLDRVSNIPWNELVVPVTSDSGVSAYIPRYTLKNHILETFELLRVPADEQFPITEISIFLMSRGGAQVQLVGSSDDVEYVGPDIRCPPLNRRPVIIDNPALKGRIEPYR